MHFYWARDQMTYALLSPVPPHTQQCVLDSLLVSSYRSTLQTSCLCYMPGSSGLWICFTFLPPSQSPQPMETEVFLIVLFINIPAANIYGLLSSHISFIHLPCRCYPGVIYILAQYRGLEVRTTCRTALVSPCSYGIYGDVGRQDRECSAFFFQWAYVLSSHTNIYPINTASMVPRKSP